MEYNNRTVETEVLINKTKYSIHNFLYVDSKRGHQSCVLTQEEPVNWMGFWQ